MNSKDFGFCYRAAFESIGKENGIEKMIGEIAGRTGTTIVVTNIYGEMISICDMLNLRQKWKTFDRDVRGLVLPDQEKKTQRSEEAFESGMVIRPIEVKHNVEGFVVVFFPPEEVKEDCTEIANIIVKAASIELEHHKDRAWCSISMERQIVSEIVLGEKEHAGEDTYMKEKIGQTYLIPGFLLGIVWCPKNQQQGRLQSIRNQIYEKDQNLLSYLEGEKLYLLFTGRKEEEKTTAMLGSICHSLGGSVCVGSLFSDKDEIRSRKCFLEHAARIGSRMEPCEDFIRGREYFLETVCSYAASETGFHGYYCEQLDRLRQEDNQKGTEFYGSLKQYLLSGNNVSMAAKKLYVHRNTMIYRLQKIHEILNINPNEPDTARMLLISMILQELIDRTDKKVDEEGDLR